MSIPRDLITAYRAALYEVDAGVTITLCVDRQSPLCDQVLRAHNATKAALITAYNPRSRLTSGAHNAAAHAALRETAMQLNKAYLPSRARDPAGVWPVEPGLFILDIAERDARALADRFDQHAFIWIEIGGAATLVCTA